MFLKAYGGWNCLDMSGRGRYRSGFWANSQNFLVLAASARRILSPEGMRPDGKDNALHMNEGDQP